jgi:Zn-dependent alcohol dehydrogenase
MESGHESKAIICESEDHDSFTVKTLTVGSPSHGQVLVRMKYATFSVHDKLQHGFDPSAEYPYLAGYDGVGTVEEVGEGVEEFEKGDHVAVFIVPGNRVISDKTNVNNEQVKVLNSGKFWSYSPHLKAYSEEKEIKGFKGVGTWSQLAVFYAGNLMKLDHEPEVNDAGLGSVLAVGLMSPDKVVNIDEEGANIAVFGSNSVALTLVSGLKRKNPASIVVVGHKDDQEVFEKLGAIYVVDEGEAKDVQAKLMEISADGYDYTFETTNFSRYGAPSLEVCHKGWGK